jgi:hypothetical protein
MIVVSMMVRPTAKRLPAQQGVCDRATYVITSPFISSTVAGLAILRARGCRCAAGWLAG